MKGAISSYFVEPVGHSSLSAEIQQKAMLKVFSLKYQ